MSELQFLAAQKSLGNLILVQGTSATGATGSIASYTPPSGKKFTLVKAGYGCDGAYVANLRNNGTVIDIGIGE